MDLKQHCLLLCLLVGLGWLVVGNAPASAADTRPNIILIMADDMGYECVGANGGTSYQTPHLDKLAAGGLRFTHCYSQPICTPSRVQIMTGIYNQRNYIRFGLLDPKATTFAHLLKKAGYKTCIVGKWQLSGGLEAPNNFGFDEYCLWQLTRRPNRYPNPGLEINGKEVDFKEGQYGPDIVSDYLCDFIERHKDGPFLAYYPMMLPHWPFEPTPDSPDWDPTFRRDDKQEKGLGMRKHKHFADMVKYTDKVVGKIVNKLDELGIRENTIVLFTGDNGTFTGITSKMGDLKVQGGKGKTTDAGTRVPFVVNWKGTAPVGKVSNDLVDFSDFLPTLAEAAGVDVPAKLKIDGRSFLPQLKGERGNPREWTFCWYARNGGPTGKEFARDHRYKLYRNGAFYDIEQDVLEKSPLSLDQVSESIQARHAKLQAVLEEMMGTRRAKSVKPKKKPKAKPKPDKNKAEKNGGDKASTPGASQ